MLEMENAPAREGEGACKLPGYRRDDSNGHAAGQFQTPRDAALALLSSGTRLSRNAGSFLGQCAVDPMPLTAAQAEWLATLLDRAGLPPLGGEA